MKKSFLILAASLCLAAPVFAQSATNSDMPPPPPHHAMLTADERTELKSAHEAAIAANPDLKTQGEQLHQQMKDFEQKMHDAMVKADPKVEPILQKMEAAHHHHHGPPMGEDDGGNG